MKEGIDSPKAFSQHVVGKRRNFKENHVETTRCAMFFFEVLPFTDLTHQSTVTILFLFLFFVGRKAWHIAKARYLSSCTYK